MPATDVVRGPRRPRFLRKKGCTKVVGSFEFPAPDIDIDTLVPRASSKLMKHRLFQKYLRKLLDKKASCKKTVTLNDLIEVKYLPFSGNVDGIPGGHDPLTDLDDIQDAVGTIMINVSGSVVPSNLNSGKCDCCDLTTKLSLSGRDYFSWHDTFLNEREFNIFGIFGDRNPFAMYYDACSFLQDKKNGCGYCKVGWKFSNNITATGRHREKRTPVKK